MEPKKTGRRRGRPPGIRTAASEFGAPTGWTLGLISRLGEIASAKQIKAAKNYARSGRGVGLAISPGLIEAKVQGRRSAPYMVRLRAHRPDEGALADMLGKIREKAIYKTALLFGEMPPELEGIFRSSGVTLSLNSFAKNQQMCACSEPDGLCKHMLAVMYVAASAFDRDPFMLLKLRGLEKDDLMAARCAPVGSDVTVTFAGAEEPGGVDCVVSGGLASSPRAEDFYGSRGLLAAATVDRSAPSSERTRPMPMFDFPLWRGETSFADSIAPYYKMVRKFIAGAKDGADD